ncbi:MAG: hypothetical protein K2N35_10565 [Muribaculaceae bacterium]|nr:hypothetical protein [Muribaculaceae bacterium]
MNTVAFNKVEKTKKLIDLPNDVCHRLAIRAAAMGTSVKRLIESIVIDSMEDTDDDTIFAYLCKTRPEGKELMSDEDQENLMATLRKKAAVDEI